MIYAVREVYLKAGKGQSRLERCNKMWKLLPSHLRDTDKITEERNFKLRLEEWLTLLVI